MKLLLTVMIDVRYEGQPGKLSEIQSDPSRVATRVARLGPRLLFRGALGAIRIVFAHCRRLLLLLLLLCFDFNSRYGFVRVAGQVGEAMVSTERVLFPVMFASRILNDFAHSTYIGAYVGTRCRVVRILIRQEYQNQSSKKIYSYYENEAIRYEKGRRVTDQSD